MGQASAPGAARWPDASAVAAAYSAAAAAAAAANAVVEAAEGCSGSGSFSADIRRSGSNGMLLPPGPPGPPSLSATPGCSAEVGAAAIGADAGDVCGSVNVGSGEVAIETSESITTIVGEPPDPLCQQRSTGSASFSSIRGAVAGNAGPLPVTQMPLGSAPSTVRGGKDPDMCSVELEEELVGLRKQLAESEQVGAEAMHRLREVQVDREMWKSRCDQMQAQLDQSWSVYEKAQTNWEEAEERVLVVRRCWDRDRRRLREAERLLRELGYPMEPSMEEEGLQRSPHTVRSFMGSELSVGGAPGGAPGVCLGASGSVCSAEAEGGSASVGGGG